MSQYFTLHPDSPQPRLIKQAVAILRDGGVIAFLTDSSYALGCHLGDKSAQDRIRAIREVDDKHHFTLMCRDLSEISRYAQVNNIQFRLLKANTPGSYTFILEATREVPKRLQHPKRNTIGLRVPMHSITLALLEELGEPILSMTLILPGDELPMHEAEDIRDRLEKRLALIVDAGACGVEPTTVIDLTHAEPVLIRAGLGALQPFGLN